MANTLTGLIPDLYAALDKVSRELVGFVPAVGANLSGTPAALNEDIVIPLAPTSTSSDIAPSMTLTDPADQVIDNVKVSITKSKSVAFAFVGEEQRGLDNGAGHLNVQAKMIAQAMRTLVNEIEADVAATYISTSRAYGTAGTTPFASDLSDTAQLRKLLADNGSPMADMQLVLNTTAGANMRTLTNLTHANEAASDDLLRQGVLTDLHGFAIRESAQVASVSVGAGSGYLVNNGGGYSEGDTSIVVDTGTGNVNAGDVITFAGDTNKYVVTTGITGAGTLVIAAPGLQQDLADDSAITSVNDFEASLAFDRDAIQLVTRAPAMPKEGDARIDSMVITDPISGLSFEVSVWAGNRKVKYEIALAWGVKNIKPEHSVMLLG